MGRPKAGLEVGGQTLISRVLTPLADICREVIVVARHPVDFLEFKYRIVRDLVPGQGPLGGLATGLFYARFPMALTLACDLPLIHPEVLDYIARKALAAPQGARAVVPRTKLGWQPLVAAYSASCLSAARALLAEDRHKVEALVERGVYWQAIPEEEIRALDPDLDSFLNVNTPGDLAEARTRMATATPS